MLEQKNLYITSQNDNEEEICYLNIVLQYILEHSTKGIRIISETDILDLILETAKIFKKMK